MPIGDFESKEARKQREEREELLRLGKRARDDLKEDLELDEKKLKSMKETDAGYATLQGRLIQTRKLYKDLIGEVRLLSHEHEDAAIALKKVQESYTEHIDKLKKVSGLVSKVAGTLKEGISAYHSYNLSIQKAVDSTGKFEGQFARARQDFEQLRRSLNLTRKDAVEFADAWSTGMRLGVTNDQLKQMVGNLQKIHGQTQGLAMARQVLATPMTRTTAQGVGRGDVGSVATAMRSASLEQAQALANTLRKPENRPVQTQEAVRYERAQAKVALVLDDIKAGMQTFAAAGIAPETAALLTPLSSLDTGMQKLIGIQESMRTLMALKGAANIPGVGGLATKLLGSGGGAGGGIINKLLGGAGGGAGEGGAGGIMGRLKGTGGLDTKLLGSGGGAGGIMGRLKGTFGFSAGRTGAGAVGVGAGMGMDYVADRMQEGSLGQKGMRVGGWAARGAGMGASVGGVHGAVAGAVIGGVVGVAEQFGGEWVKYVKESAEWFGTGVKDATNEWVRGITGVEEPKEKVDMGSLLNEQVTTAKGVKEQLANLGTTLENLPETLRASIAVRAGEVGVASISREGIESAKGALGARTAASTDVIMKEINAQISRTMVDRANVIAKAKGSGKSSAEIAELEKGFQNTFDTIEAELQNKLKGMDLGAGGRLEMKTMETRRGQVGLEREAAAGRFRRTGAITGDAGEIAKYREAINRTYADEAKLIEKGGIEAEKSVDADKESVKKLIEQNKDNALKTRQLRLQLQELENQRLDIRRNVANQKEINELNKMNAELENDRAMVTEYELHATYQRGQAQQNLAKAQEEFAKERGGTPGEVGGYARKAAAGSQQALDEFNKTFKQSIDDLTNKAKAARGPGGEGEAKAVQYEKIMYDLKQKGVELERTSYNNKLNSIKAEEQFRQENISVQKSTMETLRDYAAQTGQSWRIQMGYQSQIIQASREDLESSRKVFEEMKAAGITGLPLAKQQLEVVQKQSALGQAILGKQRDFLEKAVAAGFGMGGGSKAQPNINPRVFGEVIKDVRGQLWQGAPRTIEETRQAGGANIRGAIGVGAGGINAAPVRPGANPEAAGLGAVAGAAAAAGGGAKEGGVDVSGNFTVAVNFDNEMFRGQVKQIAVNAYREDIAHGA